MKTFLILGGALAIAFLITAAERNSLNPQPVRIVPIAGRQPELPPFKSPEEMQAEFHRRFLASPGFGMSRVLRPVFLAPVPVLVHNDTKYRVVPPDLIGLEDEPTVYAPHEHAFRIPKTTNSPSQLFRTRPLNAFETNAVAAIRAGRDLVVATIAPTDHSSGADQPAPELLVVGPLRADASCAKCHQCEIGKLLGAFTYTLKPIGLPSLITTNSAALSKL
jgi:hypothetical protein